MRLHRSAVCAALLLLSLWPAASPTFADEFIADDAAAGVQVTGSWAPSTSSGGFVGDGYRYRVPGDGTSAVRWPFPGPAPAGRYEVFARWTDGDNRATNARYVVTHTTGKTEVVVDQRTNGATWRSLGQFEFRAAPEQGVSLSDQADGVVVADAVRWATPGAPIPAASAASPAATVRTTPASTSPPAASPAAAASATPAASSTPLPIATPTVVPAATAAASDPRFFTETRFRIDRDVFWDFFQKRGGVRTFGFPVSREFTMAGCATQLFQRVAMQQCGTQGVGTLNMLDDGLLPYTRFAGSTVPAPDPRLISEAPPTSDPDYGTHALEYLRANTPDTFEGEAVNFLNTYLGTVRAGEAFPQGGDESLLPLLNMQLWGLPTSKPAWDPNNHEFVYQRFQRGVMHYDRGCKCTQGLLLADYLKAVLTGERLPEDLAVQAASSPLLRAAVGGGRPPSGTSFGDAFVQQQPVLVAVPVGSPPVTVSSPDLGMSVFLWGNTATTDRDLKLITDAGFRWQKTLFQWRAIEGACKGCFDWTESDRIVKASAQAGVKILARLDFQPKWARADGAQNGPPDNYQDFADFVAAFVKRYGATSSVGRVHAIEVWNEVNLDREWGGKEINRQQAADYVRLLGLAYTAAKAADPGITIVTAGLSPTGVNNGRAADDVQYLQWLYDAGMKGKYDVLGAHGNTQAPEVEAAFGTLPNFPHASFYFRRIEQLREVMVKNGDSERQVWLLEFGWTSDTIHGNYSWFAVSEEKKSANILKAFEYARANWRPWIGLMTVWTVADPTWSTEREEYWWAITNKDGTPRIAYTELVKARRAGLFAWALGEG